jgi:hypothetical protein
MKADVHQKSVRTKNKLMIILFQEYFMVAK